MSDVDVVVAGAGGAGVVAAIAAAQGGKSVALLEWKEHFRAGNNTSMSTSMIPAGGSRWQAEAGIDDSPAEFFADVERKTHGTANRTVAAALVDVAPDLVAWLVDDCRVPLQLVDDFVYPGHSHPRCHSVEDRSGSTLLRHLLAAVGDLPIDLIVPLRVIDVELDDDRVVAAIVEDPSGQRERVTTDSVVLATGGFGANRELLRANAPEILDAVYFGGEGCVGDALAIGDRLAADSGWLDAYQGHGSLAAREGVLATWATIMHGGILVNADGRRFGDETIGYSEYARMVLDQPGGNAWLIIDERIDAACRPFKDYRDLLEAGGVRDASDVAALAAATKLDELALAQTLDGVATAARGDVVDSFGRTHFEAPLSAPYRWIRVTGALFHTQGGLLVDGAARVLRDSAPIDGLYAAGGAAVGMSGHGADGYLAGNGLLGALGLGYLAGQHVATGTVRESIVAT